MNSKRALTSLQKENSGGTQGAWKDRAPDGLLKIHATAALLWSATEGIHTLQAPKPGHEDPGESDGNSPGEWWSKSQVASQDEHKCI